MWLVILTIGTVMVATPVLAVVKDRTTRDVVFWCAVAIIAALWLVVAPLRMFMYGKTQVSLANANAGK